MAGCLVISLDYELLWGGIEKRFPEDYGQSNVRNVSTVLDRLTELFERYGVQATIATVGLIMKDNAAQALKEQPLPKPSYKKRVLSPYNNDYIGRIKKEDEHLYFAPETVKKLQASKCYEIGTHTYCHFYCWEDGQTLEEFKADLQCAIETAKSRNIELTSIIFPRNEVKDEYLAVCSSVGINAYRGNPKRFFNKQSTKIGRIFQRIARIADNYINISGHNTYTLDSLEVKEGCVNVPASRFLRPYSKKLSFLEPLRLRRIKNDIRYAAKHNQMYHLWWHPHNFGCNMQENLAFLEKVLDEYKVCNDRYGMTSYSMKDIQEIKMI